MHAQDPVLACTRGSSATTALCLACLTTGVVMVAGRRVEIAVDQGGNTLWCTVPGSGDCDDDTRRMARAYLLHPVDEEPGLQAPPAWLDPVEWAGGLGGAGLKLATSSGRQAVSSWVSYLNLGTLGQELRGWVVSWAAKREFRARFDPNL
jgi:hypothetical protein